MTSRCWTSRIRITDEDGLYDPGHARANIRAGGNRRQVRADQPYGARSFITNIKEGDTCQSALRRSRAASRSEAIPAYRGSISRAMAQELAGAALGTDEGKYSFRQWQHRFTPPTKGGQVLTVAAPAAAARRSPTRPTGIRAGSCATSSSGQPSYSREEGSMLRPMLPIALVVGVALRRFVRRHSQFSLKSVSVDLPPGVDMFRTGRTRSTTMPRLPLGRHGAQSAGCRKCDAGRGRQDAHAYKAPITPRTSTQSSIIWSASRARNRPNRPTPSDHSIT